MIYWDSSHLRYFSYQSGSQFIQNSESTPGTYQKAGLFLFCSLAAFSTTGPPSATHRASFSMTSPVSPSSSGKTRTSLSEPFALLLSANHICLIKRPSNAYIGTSSLALLFVSLGVLPAYV